MKLTNAKSIVVFSAETTDCYLGPRMKMFSWKCNHHVHSKDSRKNYGPPVTLSRLFQFKKTYVQRIYDCFNN